MENRIKLPDFSFSVDEFLSGIGRMLGFFKKKVVKYTNQEGFYYSVKGQTSDAVRVFRESW